MVIVALFSKLVNANLRYENQLKFSKGMDKLGKRF